MMLVSFSCYCKLQVFSAGETFIVDGSGFDHSFAELVKTFMKYPFSHLYPSCAFSFHLFPSDYLSERDS